MLIVPAGGEVLQSKRNFIWGWIGSTSIQKKFQVAVDLVSLFILFSIQLSRNHAQHLYYSGFRRQ
jgi:hypothetical protein